MRKLKDLKILTGCVAVLTVIAVGVVLQAAQNVFLPLVIAWIISYMMAPGVRFMTRLKVPVEITTFLLLALLLYITSQAGSFLSQLFAGSADKFMNYYEQLVAIWNQFSAKYNITATYLRGVDWGGSPALLHHRAVGFDRDDPVQDGDGDRLSDVHPLRQSLRGV